MSDHWNTPEHVWRLGLDALCEEIYGIDPCSNSQSTVDASCYVEEDADGLSVSWYDVLGVFGVQNAWVNPPYSKIAPWAQKCAEEFDRGIESLLLIPPSVDTAYWHKWIWTKAPAICFWRGRIAFELEGVPQKGNPKGSAIVGFVRDVDRFERVFSRVGKVVRL